MSKERRQAFGQNAQYYSSNKLCKYGHPPVRYTKTGSCVECNRERSRSVRSKYNDLIQGKHDLTLHGVRKEHMPLIRKYAKDLEELETFLEK